MEKNVDASAMEMDLLDKKSNDKTSLLQTDPGGFRDCKSLKIAGQSQDCIRVGTSRKTGAGGPNGTEKNSIWTIGNFPILGKKRYKPLWRIEMKRIFILYFCLL
ncbi:hypothetical protein [Algoriphagus boritolerans]|uniref:hypothetical protein n=1 Tax=Algoriphagus boritolerans TaxID=308111 RepID=UPI000CDF2167|nr:hypothetical protein [Algoriphagus boritolerans]